MEMDGGVGCIGLIGADPESLSWGVGSVSSGCGFRAEDLSKQNDAPAAKQTVSSLPEKQQKKRGVACTTATT